MKKISLTIGLLALVSAAFAYSGFNRDTKPAYVLAAESDTNNFLQDTYGPGSCYSVRTPDGTWDMSCAYNDEEVILKYSVRPEHDNIKRNGSRFFLETKNELAEDSSSTGLSRFLDIRTISKL